MIKSIRDQLRRDEGEVLHEYKDHLGYSTIGVGRLIDKRKGGGISRRESDFLLENDLAEIAKELDGKLGWWRTLDEVRQGVVLNMSFQMGVEGFLKFRKTIDFIRTGFYTKASNEMLSSEWARQTPERAKRLAKQIITGEWQ